MQDKEQLKASTEHERDLWIAGNPLVNGVRKERCTVWNITKNVQKANIIRAGKVYVGLGEFKLGFDAFEAKEAALDYAEKEREREIRRLLNRIQYIEQRDIDVTDHTLATKP
jgi:hypothetical protein